VPCEPAPCIDPYRALCSSAKYAPLAFRGALKTNAPDLSLLEIATTVSRLRLASRQLIVFTFSSRMKAVLALTLFLTASCVSLRSRSTSSLVGEWRYADKIQGCHYVFNRDGSFKGEVVYHARLISKFTGRWSVDGDTLLYTYVSDMLDRIPAGATDRDKLLSVHREFFIIEAADGSRRKYLRVR
jgi:hypothetical protein